MHNFFINFLFQQLLNFLPFYIFCNILLESKKDLFLNFLKILSNHFIE